VSVAIFGTKMAMYSRLWLGLSKIKNIFNNLKLKIFSTKVDK
jgi:hypothetical protein